jgi:hypothetical protein
MDLSRWKRLYGGNDQSLPQRAPAPAITPAKPTASADGTEWQAQIERFGDILVNVVGESHYQPAIRRACDWQRGTDTRFECMAELVPEPTNEYDPNAVMVKIDGERVGYLSRDDAVRLGPAIRQAIDQQGTGMCRAMIAGHANDRTDNLGVFLHLDAELA